MKYLFTLLLLAFGINAMETVTPLPLPKTIRIESAELRHHVWNRLTPQQKKLTYYLVQAAREGKSLLFLQNHRHALAIKAILEKSTEKKAQAKTKKMLGDKGWAEYLMYSAKFMDMAGPYASSNRKYILKEATSDQITKLVDTYGVRVPKETKAEIVKLLTDPTFEVQRAPESPTGEGLESTGGNLYEKGITGKDVLDVLDKSLKTTLNCRVIKKSSGPTCEIHTTKSPGIVGKQLRKVVASLEKAKTYSESKLQKEQLEATIRYFKKGDVEEFRKANIAWVKDRSSSVVDTMIGWVEVYEDWLARIASWESYVQVIDPEISKTAQSLASHAQHFEDGMPYGNFKKTFPKDYSPPAIMVYYFQEISSYRTGGYNLPNFDDIRRDVGAKNVIRLPMPGESEDPDLQNTWREVFNEFLPASKTEAALKNRERVYRVLVLLHEIIGHGSGTYDTTKYGKNEDPISGLGSLGSALEEQRADLTALVFGGDPKLVEIGIYKDEKEAKEMLHIMYDLYLTDFLRRTSGQRSFAEAHQRGHWLFINQLLDAGVITWGAKDGKSKTTPENQVLFIKDYEKFHKVAVDSLAELQKVKATRDEKRLKELFDKMAPLDAISQPWAKAVIQRGENLKINAGYVEQPWSIDSRGGYKAFGERTLEGIAAFAAEMGP